MYGFVYGQEFMAQADIILSLPPAPCPLITHYTFYPHVTSITAQTRFRPTSF